MLKNLRPDCDRCLAEYRSGSDPKYIGVALNSCHTCGEKVCTMHTRYKWTKFLFWKVKSKPFCVDHNPNPSFIK
jgi:hypothetical protein